MFRKEQSPGLGVTSARSAPPIPLEGHSSMMFSSATISMRDGPQLTGAIGEPHDRVAQAAALGLPRRRRGLWELDLEDPQIRADNLREHYEVSVDVVNQRRGR